jgi:hypothetical protein
VVDARCDCPLDVVRGGVERDAVVGDLQARGARRHDDGQPGQARPELLRTITGDIGSPIVLRLRHRTCLVELLPGGDEPAGPFVTLTEVEGDADPPDQTPCRLELRAGLGVAARIDQSGALVEEGLGGGEVGAPRVVGAPGGGCQDSGERGREGESEARHSRPPKPAVRDDAEAGAAGFGGLRTVAVGSGVADGCSRGGEGGSAATDAMARSTGAGAMANA